MISTCGNGVINTGEKCDDGNTISGDGCSSNCGMIETAFKCPTPGAACTARPTCSTFVGADCNDGNYIDNDGCTDCMTDFRYVCPLSVATAGVCRSLDICGNSKRTLTEECDDGNSAINDGCDDSCHIESGWSCRNGNSVNRDTCFKAVCGDGLTQGNEECDGGDYCTNDCKAYIGFKCAATADATDCPYKFTCERNLPAVCTSGEASVHTNDCCGDGYYDFGEECDHGLTGSHYCNTDCTLKAHSSGVKPKCTL